MKQPDLGFQTILIHYMIERAMGTRRVAKAVGCDHSTIVRLANGTRKPSWEMAHKLALAFTLGPDDTANFMASAGYLAPGYLPIPWKIARAVNEMAE